MTNYLHQADNLKLFHKDLSFITTLHEMHTIEIQLQDHVLYYFHLTCFHCIPDNEEYQNGKAFLIIRH